MVQICDLKVLKTSCPNFKASGYLTGGAYKLYSDGGNHHNHILDFHPRGGLGTIFSFTTNDILEL